MGYCGENVKAIVDDLKGSWYFRVWGLLWVVCAVTVFAALIVFGSRSTLMTKEKDTRFWIENATSIDFPTFHIRLHEDDASNGFTIAYKRCWHDGQLMQTKTCDWNGHSLPLDTCFAVVGGARVFNEWNKRYNESRIYCEVNTTGGHEGENTMLAYSIEDNNQASYGGILYHTAWIAPNEHAWVTLYKSIIKGHKNPEIVEWEKRVSYHSDVKIENHYIISTVINTFRVPHIETRDGYTPFMGVADAGGFAFFTVILHTIFMAIFGICLNNDSTFLRKEGTHRPL